MDDLERTGNLIEAGFWVVFATAIAIGASSQPRSLKSLGFTARRLPALRDFRHGRGPYRCLVASLVVAGLESPVRDRAGAMLSRVQTTPVSYRPQCGPYLLSVQASSSFTTRAGSTPVRR